MMPRRAFPLGALCAAALLAAPPVLAQPAYPSKPITIVVGYPPGGSTDLTGRTLGDALSRQLGVPVVIENLGGAGGTIGAQKVASAAPDGYTLLVGANNEVAISKLVTKTVKYELKDFTPLGLIASQPMVLVASTATGVKNLGEFIAKAKAAPGKYSYGSSGVGTALHLAGEMVTTRLKTALAEALKSPEFRQKMEASGSTVAAPGADVQQFLASEVAKYQKIVQFAKIEQ